MNSLTGTGSLIRLALRRDRIQLPVWIVVITSLVAGTASAFIKLYPDVPSRLEFAASIEHTPALLALTGPAFDLSTIGGLTAWRICGIASVLAALMSLFAVIRYTRADEQAGRLELVGSACVGRQAPLTATLIVVLCANVILGLLASVSLLAQGLPGAGSFALGLAIASGGCVFALIAAVAAQLVENSRTAVGISAAILGLSFLLRAAGDAGGDTGPTWLSWLSPIGWTQQTRAFADERWWVFALPVALAVILAFVAYIMVARRDIGAGLFSARTGRAVASRSLSGTFGLAWRLQRATLVGWLCGSIVFGVVIGSVAQGVAGIVDSSQQIKQIIDSLGGKQGVVDAFLAAVMGIIGFLASAYTVQATLRLRAEEASSHAEAVLATSVGRVRFAVSHLVFAILGSAVILFVAGLATGITHGLQTNDVPNQVSRLLGAAMAQLPAVVVLTGIACVLFGLLPRLAVLSWALLIVFLLLGQLGALFQLDQWVMDISPFAHIPKLPGAEVTFGPLAWLVGIAVVLIVLGLVGFRNRNVSDTNG